MFHNRKRYSILFRIISVILIQAFFLSNLALASPDFSLARWTANDDYLVRREALAKLYRDSRLIRLATSPRYLDLLTRHNALALLLPSGRYLMTPEIAANDLSLIRAAAHEDFEVLMQQEEKLHSTRYQRLKKRLLDNEEIMAPYRNLSGYKDITAEPDNIIFNDLIAKAFELLFIIGEYLVYPNTELTKEERDFIKLMRPLLEAKDTRGRYKNFSQVFFDVDRRTKAIQALQEDKSERFYRVANAELLDVTPHRLTIAECRQRLIDNLKVIESLYPALQKEFAYGLEVFRSEGIDAFERKAYPRILKATDAVKSRVDVVSSLPAIFGFVEPELQSKLDAYLHQIAEELNVDKVLIWFLRGWAHDFTYTLGFTEEELIKFHLNLQEIFRVIEDSEDSKADKDSQLKGLVLMKESGMTSGLEASPDYEIYSRGKDNYIRIVIGRSQKSVELHGELTEEDRKALTRQINALIIDKTAPWLGIRNSLDSNQYSDFSDFMMVLRHNGGIDVFKVGYFPFIYWHIPQYIRKIMANDSESQKWQDGFIGNLQYFVDESRTINSMETFLQILESGTDFKPRNITQYVHDRVESFRGMAISKGLDFSTEIANENMVVGRCDLNMLGIVVDNLIQNAIKYTKEGKVQVRLAKKMMKPQTGPSGERECAVLEVEDTGIGIPADDKTKIFTRGYRASNVGDIQGTDIGLDAVSTIVHLMHGDIDVESEVGKGTKITVSIPLSHDKEPPDNKAPPTTPTPSDSPDASAIKAASAGTDEDIKGVFSEIDQYVYNAEPFQGRPPFDVENFLDMQPDQVEVVTSDMPLEFGPGKLYHGRDGLDEAIISGVLTGDISLTRVGHQWGISNFQDKYESPAIFVVRSELFNKLMHEGKAALELVGERTHGMIDPYPKINIPLPIDAVEEIWIDVDTYERYKAIIHQPATDSDRDLSPKLKRLFLDCKIKVIPNLRHTQLNSETYFDATLKAVGGYMVGDVL